MSKKISFIECVAIFFAVSLAGCAVAAMAIVIVIGYREQVTAQVASRYRVMACGTSGEIIGTWVVSEPPRHFSDGHTEFRTSDGMYVRISGPYLIRQIGDGDE